MVRGGQERWPDTPLQPGLTLEVSALLVGQVSLTQGAVSSGRTSSPSPALVPPPLQSRGHRATPTLNLIRWLCHCGQRPPPTEGLGDWPCQPSPASVPRPTQRALWGKLEADRWVPGLSFGSSEEEASRQPLSALPEECQTLDPFPWFCFLHAFGFCFVFILKNIQFRVKGQG